LPLARSLALKPVVSPCLSIIPNSIVPVVVGKYVVFGCLVTEGVDATDNIVALEGQATGDEVNLNADLSATPSRGFEFPNIGSTLGGMFASNDIDTVVATAPATGTARYDIAYIFAGKEGSGFAIQTGTPSVAIKDDFDTYGLDTSAFGEAHDSAIPLGSLPIARIYVEDDVTGIPDARIADIRDLVSSLLGDSVTSTDSSATPNTMLRQDGTSGQVIKKTNIVIDDSDNVTGMGSLSLNADGANLDLLMTRINSGAGVGRLRIDSNGDLVLGATTAAKETILSVNAGDAVKIQDTSLDVWLQGGLSFNDGTDVMDSYVKVNTYTATMTAGSGTITLTANNILTFEEVGGLVWVYGRVSVASISSPTGRLELSLPFTNQNITATAEVCRGSIFYNDINALSVAGAMIVGIGGGDNTMSIQEQTTTGFLDNTATKIKVGSEIGISIFFRKA